MKDLVFCPNKTSLTSKQKAMVTEMTGCDDRWLTICHENDDGDKDLSKTINLSTTEVDVLKNVSETIMEIITNEDEDFSYSLSKYTKKDREPCWDSKKKITCYVIRGEKTESLLNDKVYTSEEQAETALKYADYDAEVHPEKYVVKEMLMNQPDRCAVVEHILREELAKKSDSGERSLKGMDKYYVAALLSRTLKYLQFTSPISAFELLDNFLYFGGFDKALTAIETPSDIHDRQQLNLVSTCYNQACSFMQCM
jgi:hypothetical protein